MNWIDIFIYKTPVNTRLKLLEFASNYSTSSIKDRSQRDHLDIKKTTFKIKQTKHGKPYFKNLKNLEFNISHSGPYTVLAFSNTPVGVDIEILKKRNFKKILARIANEHERLYQKRTPDFKKYFYKIWTQKEAISKCQGLGFKMGFKKIYRSDWFVKSFKYDETMLSVASPLPARVVLHQFF